MGKNQQYERIIDFILRNPDIPEDIRLKINSWMLNHENDPLLQTTMRSAWDREFGKSNKAVDHSAIIRLLNEVETSGHLRSSKKTEPLHNLAHRKKTSIRRWTRYAAAIMAIAVSSLVTFLMTYGHQEQQIVLVTAKGSVGEYTLPDGSVVKLNSDSRLTFTPDNFGTKGKRKVSVEGEAFFDVKKDPGHPFIVKMTNMDVEVTGTSFDVRNYSFSKTEEVVLMTGKVNVGLESGGKYTSHTLRPDQRLVFNRSSDTYTLEDSDAKKYCSWFNHRLKLENEPLGDILIAIGRRYCVDLEVNSDVDTTRRLSLTITDDNLEEIMGIINYLTGVRYTISDNTLSIKQ